ncbi:MAG: ABC transporter ATP-binding protein [Bacteroidetes bacterium QS_9_68_14]|nr:MAG: ABC transporter ATP-binding protein [Bacteroidetes bacterium QS_9_68_14]
MPEDAPAVAVRDLAKTYRSGVFKTRTVEALQGVTLEVETGEIFGLLGPNGAGKTTLVKSLLGIVYPTGGRAELFGVPATRSAARAPVGYLPENHRFPEFLTARKMLDTYGALSGVAPRERKARIPELLEKVKMAEAADARVGTFSKGMLQRTGLAQALLSRPRLLFLDEPTDGVDPVGRRQIRDILVELRAEGTTVFLNSHLLSEVEQVCSRVAILNEGEFVREGTIEELTQSEHVYDLRATPVPEETRQALPEGVLTPAGEPPPGEHTDGEALGAEATPAETRRYRVTADSRAHLNDVIDRLRRGGVELESITPRRQTLEDYFIDVVSRGEEGRGKEKEVRP